MPWALIPAVAVVWALFLIPGWCADRANQTLGAPRSGSESGSSAMVERALARSGDAGATVAYREAVLARRRQVVSVLLGAAVASLAGWFILNSLWMLLIHVIVDAVLVWYIVMLRRVQTFREDVNALFADYDDVAPTRDYSAVKVVQPR